MTRASYWAASKQNAGFDMNGDGYGPLARFFSPTYSEDAIASAETIEIPVNGKWYTVSGSTSVVNIGTEDGNIYPGREIYITGAAGASFVVTATATSSTASGKVHLVGDRAVNPQSILHLRQAANGSWVELSYVAVG